MPRELEPWGGVARWLARLLHKRTATETDSPERGHERHQPEYPDRSVFENVDRALFGAFYQPSAGDRRPKRK